MNDSLQSRIDDRADVSWFTPSQKQVWASLQRFDGAPYRVINIYGGEGTGKTFIGKQLERLRYASYHSWSNIRPPLLPRLTLDDIMPNRTSTRDIRPLVDKYNISQIILLSNTRVDERDMPAFELQVTEEDIASFRACLHRYLSMTIPEECYQNYKQALATLL